MTVRLRPHHLLCMLTYVGRGYSPAFTANYDAIAVRLSEGEPIAIVDGPDDVCGPLLGDRDPHCRNLSVRARDLQAAMDLGPLLGHPVRSGVSFVLDPSTVAALRRSFADQAIRTACSGCEWSELCSEVAIGGFDAVRVAPIR